MVVRQGNKHLRDAARYNRKPEGHVAGGLHRARDAGKIVAPLGPKTGGELGLMLLDSGEEVTSGTR